MPPVTALGQRRTTSRPSPSVDVPGGGELVGAGEGTVGKLRRADSMCGITQEEWRVPLWEIRGTAEAVVADEGAGSCWWKEWLFPKVVSAPVCVARVFSG